MEWDYYTFLVRYSLYAVISVLGLWFNEAPVPTGVEAILQPEATPQKTYSTFNNNPPFSKVCICVVIVTWYGPNKKQPQQFKDGNKVCPEVHSNILSRLYVFFPFPTLILNAVLS